MGLGVGSIKASQAKYAKEDDSAKLNENVLLAVVHTFVKLRN